MNKVLIIGGPTGIGKSNLAVRLALRYQDSIIIGADSMQIYKKMNIGTGKITEGEKQGILHTMIDIVEPYEDFSVNLYLKQAKRIIDSAHKKNRLPIVVGGTGLYINALIHEPNFAGTPPDISIRNKYHALCAERGSGHLHDLLASIDPESAARIGINDSKRIIRALEIYEQSGRKKSDSVSSIKSNYDIKFYIPEIDRIKLYENINLRVDRMFEQGLIDEVIGLKEYWECKSMQAIGYKEIIDQFKKGNNPAHAIESIKQNSRRYAKRQIAFCKWIQAEKIYIAEDFYSNIIPQTDKWLNREHAL